MDFCLGGRFIIIRGFVFGFLVSFWLFFKGLRRILMLVLFLVGVSVMVVGFFIFLGIVRFDFSGGGRLELDYRGNVEV